MFGWFLGYITVVIFENFEIALVLLGQFIKFSKLHSGNFSQITLSNMWLLVLIQEILATVTEMWESEYGKYEKIWKIYKYTQDKIHVQSKLTLSSYQQIEFLIISLKRHFIVPYCVFLCFLVFAFSIQMILYWKRQ